MSRVTAPASKLARSLNTASVGTHSTLHHTSHGSVLMPKYAELLKKSNPEADSHARGITTTHRPTPQPKPSASHARPLMQTFSSSAPIPSATIAALPSLHDTPASSEFSSMRMPLLPDSFLRHAVPEAVDAPLAAPTISVVAANPGDVLPASALTEVEGMGVDGVELRFAHDAEPESHEPGMLRDLWRGLVEDVTGSQPKTA